MAENLCELFFRERGLPVIVLRTFRFFPEEDDDLAARASFATENAQANELLYRRLDIADAVSAHLLAVEREPNIGFARYIVSATSPFAQGHLAIQAGDAARVVQTLYPDRAALCGAGLAPVSDHRPHLGQRTRAPRIGRPAFDFAHVLSSLRGASDFRSALARQVG